MQIRRDAADLFTTDIISPKHGKSTAEGTFARVTIILQISGERADAGRVGEQLLPLNRLLLIATTEGVTNGLSCRA